MNDIKPIYKKLLMIAIAIYVIGVSMMQTDLYLKVCRIEHALSHMSGHGHQH